MLGHLSNRRKGCLHDQQRIRIYVENPLPHVLTLGTRTCTLSKGSHCNPLTHLAPWDLIMPSEMLNTKKLDEVARQAEKDLNKSAARTGHNHHQGHGLGEIGVLIDDIVEKKFPGSSAHADSENISSRRSYVRKIPPRGRWGPWRETGLMGYGSLPSV